MATCCFIAPAASASPKNSFVRCYTARSGGSSMDSKPDFATRLPFRLALLAALASAFGLYFGTGLHPIWWLTWLAPLPLLLIAPRLPLHSAFGVSWLAATLGALNLWRYFRHDLQSPLLLTLVVLLLPSAIFAAAVLFFRRCILRGSPMQAALT